MSDDTLNTSTALFVVAAFADVVDAVIDLVELLHLDDAAASLVRGHWSTAVVRDTPGTWSFGAWAGATDRRVTGHTHEAVVAFGSLSLHVDLDADQRGGDPITSPPVSAAAS